MTTCRYPECDGGPASGYCHNDCRTMTSPIALSTKELIERLRARKVFGLPGARWLDHMTIPDSDCVEAANLIEAFAALQSRAERPTEEEINAWIEREFRGYGIAIRKRSDPPIPGEPFMSIAIAKDLTRRAILALRPSRGEEEGLPSKEQNIETLAREEMKAPNMRSQHSWEQLTLGEQHNYRVRACRTAGAVYHTKISARRIEVTVDLPLSQ